MSSLKLFVKVWASLTAVQQTRTLLHIQKKHYVYGLKGLCSLLGCSISTAARIKQSGAIDAAVSQRGKIIVIDADLVLDILNVKKKSSGNRKGYRI